MASCQKGKIVEALFAGKGPCHHIVTPMIHRTESVTWSGVFTEASADSVAELSVALCGSRPVAICCKVRWHCAGAGRWHRTVASCLAVWLLWSRSTISRPEAVWVWWHHARTERWHCALQFDCFVRRQAGDIVQGNSFIGCAGTVLPIALSLHLVVLCSSRPERSHHAVAGRLPLVVRCGDIVPSPAFLVVLDPPP